MHFFTLGDVLLHLGQAQPDLAILAINAFRTDWRCILLTFRQPF